MTIANAFDIQHLMSLDGKTLLSVVRNESVGMYARAGAVSVMLINGNPEANLPELAALVAEVRALNPELPLPAIAPIAAPRGAPSASVTSTSLTSAGDQAEAIAGLRAQLTEAHQEIVRLKTEIAELHQDIIDLGGASNPALQEQKQSTPEVAHESESVVGA